MDVLAKEIRAVSQSSNSLWAALKSKQRSFAAGFISLSVAQTDATAVAPWLFIRPADCEDLCQKIPSRICQIGKKKKTNQTTKKPRNPTKKCCNKLVVLLGKSSCQAERSSEASCPLVGDLAGCCVSVPSLSKALMGRGRFGWKEERENMGLFAVNDNAGKQSWSLSQTQQRLGLWSERRKMQAQGTARGEQNQHRKKEAFQICF